MLRNIMERVEFFDHQDNNFNGQNGPNSKGSGDSPMLRPRHLYRQAEAWRRSARIAEQTKRFAILTSSGSQASFKRPSRNSSGNNLAKDNKGYTTPPTDSEASSLVPEETGIPPLNTTLERNVKENLPDYEDKSKKTVQLDGDDDDEGSFSLTPSSVVPSIEVVGPPDPVVQDGEGGIVFMHPIDEEQHEPEGISPTEEMPFIDEEEIDNEIVLPPPPPPNVDEGNDTLSSSPLLDIPPPPPLPSSGDASTRLHSDSSAHSYDENDTYL